MYSAGINNVLNDKSQSNTENLLSNIKYMVDKCHKLEVKNILISGLVYITSTVKSVGKKSMTNLVQSSTPLSRQFLFTTNR